LHFDERALEWLERQSPPEIIAPIGRALDGYRLSVPNNAMDIVAKAWKRGNYSNTGDASPATHRAMKTVRPTFLVGGDAAHYLWELSQQKTIETDGYIEALSATARSVFSLGWGIDFVVAEGHLLTKEQVNNLTGEHWAPAGEADSTGLRTPVEGTLNDLIIRHKAFLNRLENGIFHTPPSLSAFRMIEYRRPTDMPSRSYAAFSLLKPDVSGFRVFSTTSRALTLAGMMRHVAKMAALQSGWSDSEVNAVVLGHAPKSDENHNIVGPSRFAYLPVPSIEARHDHASHVVGDIRRVLVTAFTDGFEKQITWAQRALSGQDLISDDGEVVATLSMIPGNENMIRRYTHPSSSWVTVTPVVLPGFDDPSHYRKRLKNGPDAAEQKQLIGKLNQRIDGLLRKAIIQAGLPRALADYADLEWRKTGFFSGVERVERYGVPNHLKRFPLYHVRIAWRDSDLKALPVSGPICLGGGRFFGLGLFVPETE
jgi:CRISPR-associated protein Csb2